MALLPSGDTDATGVPVIPVTLGPHVRVMVGPPRPPPPRPPRPPAAGACWPPPGGVATTSRVFFTGSMTTVSGPDAVVRTYEKRPSGNHVALTESFTTRPLSAGASMRTARS